MRTVRQLPATISLFAALTTTTLTFRAVASPAPRGPASVPHQLPETLDGAVSRALQLRDSGQPAEAAAVLEQFLTRSPNAASAHLLLATIQRSLAGPMTGAARARQFETAAAHFQRALDLTSEPSLRLSILWSLASSYIDGNRLIDAETRARELVREDPSRPDAYALLASILRKADRAGAAVEILRGARAAMANDPEPQRRLGLYIWQHVQESPRLSREQARLLLDEALVIADSMIASRPDNDALQFKGSVLLLQANRVEQDGTRKAALTAEADRLMERLLKRAADDTSADNQRTPASKLPAACAEVERSAMQLRFDRKPLTEVAFVYENVLASYPDCAPAHLGLGRTHSGIAEQAKNAGRNAPASRLDHLEQAAVHFQRALDLAPEPDDAAAAFAALINTFGTGSLNRPAEAEALTRTAIQRFPANPTFHYRLVRMLLATGRSEQAGNALHAARASIPATAEGRHQMGAELWDIVYHDSTLSRADARKLLTEAVVVLDEAIAIRPGYREALVYKKLVLELQAARVETDAERVKALRAEVERLDQTVKDLMARQTLR